MPRRKCTIRALAGALAVAAIGAPAAQAYPPDMHASVAQAAAAERAAAAKTQDLRSPDARDAAVLHLRASQGDTRLPSAPTWPANPQPVAPQPVVTDSGGGSDIDWATIGIGVALSLGLVGGLAALAARRQRRLPRMRVGT